MDLLHKFLTKIWLFIALCCAVTDVDAAGRRPPKRFLENSGSESDTSVRSVRSGLRRRIGATTPAPVPAPLIDLLVTAFVAAQTPEPKVDADSAADASTPPGVDRDTTMHSAMDRMTDRVDGVLERTPERFSGAASAPAIMESPKSAALITRLAKLQAKFDSPAKPVVDLDPRVGVALQNVGKVEARLAEEEAHLAAEARLARQRDEESALQGWDWDGDADADVEDN